MIGYMDGNIDLVYYCEMLCYGVSIVFDCIGLQGMVGIFIDVEWLSVLIMLFGEGYVDWLLFLYDSIWYWLGCLLVIFEVVLFVVKDWYFFYIFDDILFDLWCWGIIEEQVGQMMVGNLVWLFG